MAKTPTPVSPLKDTIDVAITQTHLTPPDHIVIVIEENKAYSEIIGSNSAPYINSLANDSYAASLTKMYAIEHPSQPNYLDLFSGTNQGVTDDNFPPKEPFITPNLGAELIAKGLTFKGYSEDLPSIGSNVETFGNYARKHVPWVNWQDSLINGIPSSLNLPFTSFPTDYNTLPTVSFVIPNLKNDMHDGTVAEGDTWLKNNLDGYVQWAKKHNSLFILTFDEDDKSAGNNIPTIFVGSTITAGQVTKSTTLYGLLRTIQDMYGLPYIANSASTENITFGM